MNLLILRRVVSSFLDGVSIVLKHIALCDVVIVLHFKTSHVSFYTKW